MTLFEMLYDPQQKVIIYENEVNEDLELVILWYGTCGQLTEREDLMKREVFQIDKENDELLIYLM